MENENLLLIIDPQNDFVDTEGTMYVPGAEQAVKNLCRWISVNRKNIHEIVVTQDTHRSYHIGHSAFWKETPSEFTNITSEDVRKGTYSPIDKGKQENFREDVIKYLENVEKRGQTHTIWPEHCINGSWGQAFPKDLVESLNIWSLSHEDIGKDYKIIQKGLNPEKEMYSAFSYADGVVENKEQLILRYIRLFKKIYIAGFAKDYCVAETVKDLVRVHCKDTELIFLDNCMAAIDKNSKNMKIYEEAINKGIARYE